MVHILVETNKAFHSFTEIKTQLDITAWIEFQLCMIVQCILENFAFSVNLPLRLSSESFLAPLIQAAFLAGYLHLEPIQQIHEKIQYIAESKTALTWISLIK